MKIDNFYKAHKIVQNIELANERICGINSFLEGNDVDDGLLSRMTLWLANRMPTTIDKIKDIAREYKQQLEKELKELEKELEAL